MRKLKLYSKAKKVEMSLSIIVILEDVFSKKLLVHLAFCRYSRHRLNENLRVTVIFFCKKKNYIQKTVQLRMHKKLDGVSEITIRCGKNVSFS